jgi:periplasmic protein TonB
MTAAAADCRADRAAKPRWAACLVIVLALHAGLLLIIALRRVSQEPIGMPPAAVMVDLAPAPVAVPAEPPPPPAPPDAQSPPPAPPKLEPSPAPHPEVALPAPPPMPKPKRKAKRVEHPPTPRRQAEPVASPREWTPPAPAAPPATASQTSAAQSTPSTAASARATWQAQLVAWLERYKRYPRVAQEQRQQGVVYLRFAIDRQGRVLSSQISKSSGFVLLDEEVLALIQRAQPVPSPPPEIGGNRIELQIPVAFSLRR